jgi:hypothetical protein
MIAQATPVRASRIRPCGEVIGETGISMTRSDWIEHWKANMMPWSTSRAKDPARNTTTRICQVPEPMVARATSPSSTPIITPQDISPTLRSFFSVEFTPMMTKAAIAAKNGVS